MAPRDRAWGRRRPRLYGRRQSTMEGLLAGRDEARYSDRAIFSIVGIALERGTLGCQLGVSACRTAMVFSWKIPAF